MEALIVKWNNLNGIEKRAFGDRWITNDSNLESWNKSFEDLSDLKKKRVLSGIENVDKNNLNYVIS